MSRWTIAGLASAVGGFGLGPVDLELAPGRAVAVVGRSGAGKTTLLRTIAGFLPATYGSVARDGEDLVETPPEKRRIGYVPQGLGLFPHLTVQENVAYPLRLRGRPEAKARSRLLLARFGIASLASRRPHQLSSGESQKAALARALAAEPELLLWDEPAHALDVEARDDLRDVFTEMAGREGVPLLLVTHDPELAFSLADRFVLLDSGRVAFSGASSELVARPPDLFTARFAGFENILSRSALATATGPLATWLLSRAGPEGVAFPAVSWSADAPGLRVEGRLVSSRPEPGGASLVVDVGGLRVRARKAGSSGRLEPGASIVLIVPESEVCPLAGISGAPEAAG